MNETTPYLQGFVDTVADTQGIALSWAEDFILLIYNYLIDSEQEKLH
jgi:hypothetical protein